MKEPEEKGGKAFYFLSLCLTIQLCFNRQLIKFVFPNSDCFAHDDNCYENPLPIFILTHELFSIIFSPVVLRRGSERSTEWASCSQPKSARLIYVTKTSTRNVNISPTNCSKDHFKTLISIVHLINML